MLVQLLAHAQGSDLDDGLDHGHQLRIALALLVDQGLQVLEGQLVAELIPPVILVVLLDCVVGEVDVGVADVVVAEVELIRRGAQVALLEDEHLQLLGEEHPHSDIELATSKQQRPLHVFLHHEGTGPDREV